jgi:ABC-type glycerol-3-phosphate transport system substrate-binding protein
MNRRNSFIYLISLLCLIASCGRFGGEAVLLTDRPEFAFYANLFNTAQDKYKIRIVYKDNAAEFFYGTSRGADANERPDIIVGSWLKSASTLKLWQNLDFLFARNGELENSFYPALLALGRFDNKQYLLPVSFDLPVIVFSESNSQLMSNPFTIELEEIKTLGKDFNEERGNVFTRMGFSPLWNDNFLFETAVLFNAAFREGGPLDWDEAAISDAADYMRGWVEEANGGVKAEDEFFFKYFFDPPAKLVNGGRILFAYMTSSEFFTMPGEMRAELDFRTLSGGSLIPVAENAVYYGLNKRGRAKQAARAFTVWFFNEETQMLLLKKSMENRLSDTIFGLSNGFSAMSTVNGTIFPLYYPALLGSTPPADLLAAPNILPQNWTYIKERVVIPYLRAAVRGDPSPPLSQRLNDWLRVNNTSIGG